MFFDFQIHSEFSFDSYSSVKKILEVATQKKLHGIAIPDHETFRGTCLASKLAKSFDLLIIPAMEVKTEEGDIIGLFLQEELVSRSFETVVAEIKEQGGLVMLPHPFKRRTQIPPYVLDRVDVVEVFNARGQSFVGYDCNAKAYQLALNHGLPMVAGSDAHFLWEVGRGTVKLPSVNNLEQLKNEIVKSVRREICAKSSSLYNEVLSQAIKSLKTKDSLVLKSSLRKFVRTTKWYIKRTAL